MSDDDVTARIDRVRRTADAARSALVAQTVAANLLTAAPGAAQPPQTKKKRLFATDDLRFAR